MHKMNSPLVYKNISVFFFLILMLFYGNALAFDVGADPESFISEKQRLQTCPENGGGTCELSLGTDTLRICGGTWTLEGLTSSRAIVIQGAQGTPGATQRVACTAEKTTFILNGVTIAAANRAALSILNNNKVDLIIKRGTYNVFQAAGDTAAGIYIPGTASLNIEDEEDGDKNLHVGILYARGAGAFGIDAPSSNLKSSGGGAGIGAAGASVPTGGTRGVSGNAATSSFGSVTISGGMVIAQGGMGSAPTSSGSGGGGGAGIGGGGGVTGRYSSGNQWNFAGTTNGGQISVSGGTIYVQGGLANFGNGIGYGGTATNTANTGYNSISITGGSLTSVEDLKIVNNYPQFTATSGGIPAPTGRTRSVIKLGENIDAVANKEVSGCSFGATYGCNSVYPDAQGQVYFWLANAPTTNDNMTVKGVPVAGIPTDRIYAYVSGTNPYQFDPDFIAPTMSVPNSVTNGLIGVVGENCGVEGACDATGAYKTGFRMSLTQNVAAVGKQVTLYKGAYIPNDVKTEANHSATWYRTTGGVTCFNAQGIFTEKEGCVKTSITEAVFPAGASYTPVAADYGNYVWAEVKVNGSATQPYYSTVAYPSIQIGTVVSVQAIDGDELFEDEEIEKISEEASVLYQGSSRVDKLFFPSPIGAPLSAIVSPGTAKYKYEWKAYFDENGDGEIDATEIANQDNVVGVIKVNTTNPVSFELPSNGVGKNIILVVTIKNGDVPILTNIKICSNGGTCLESPLDEYGSFVNDERNTFMGNYLPKEGSITLTFAQSSVTLGDVSFGNATIEYQGKGINGLEFNYTYSGLNLGDLNVPLVVQNFKQLSAIMNRFQNNFNIEQKAKVDITSTHVNSEFILGSRTISVSLDAQPYQNNSINKICYYWDIKADDGTWDTEEQMKNNLALSTCHGVNIVNRETQALDLAYIFDKEDFGKDVRLVIRPEAPIENIVDGDNFGQINTELVIKIGILLKPGELQTEDMVDVEESFDCDDKVNGKCPTYSSVSFKGCDVYNPTTHDDNVCSEKGLVIYDDSPLKLTADAKYLDLSDDKEGNIQEFKVYGWKDNYGKGDYIPVSTSYTFTLTSELLEAAAGTGIVTISPIVKPAILPNIESITLNTTTENEAVALVVDGTDNIALLNNILTVTFNEAVTATAEYGFIDLIYNKKTETLTCDNISILSTGSETCIITNIFEKEELEDISFNQNITIKVRGFKNSSGETMQQETFPITTAPAPSIASVTIATSDLGTDYAVGHPITATLGAYSQNGGVAEGTHTYKWERRVGGIISGATDATYTPVADDYGNEIRIVVTPKDANDSIGAEVPSAWVQVGALLKFGTITDNTNGSTPTETGSTLIGMIGSSKQYECDKDVNGGTCTIGTGVVVYGDTRIQLTSNNSSDVISETWTVTNGGAVTPTNELSTTWSGSTTKPAGDVELAVGIKDGAAPVVTATYDQGTTSKEFTITISKPVTPVAEKFLTIKKATETYTAKVSESCEVAPPEETITECTLTYTDFKLNGDGVTFDGTNIQGTWELIIDDGAFEDALDNPSTAAQDPLLRFSSSGSYAISLSVYNIQFAPLTFGETPVARPIEVTNLSPNAITISASMTDDSITVTPLSSSSVAKGEKVTFTITPASSLPAGTYTKVLTIGGSHEDIEDILVNVTLVVNPRVLQVTGHPAIEFTETGTNSREYNGTTAIETTGDIVWNADGLATKPTDVRIIVSNSASGFADANVGPKNVHLEYKIVNAANDNPNTNYTFTAGIFGDSTMNHQLNATITPKTLALGFEEGVSFVKSYDFTADFTKAIEVNLVGKVGGDDVSINSTNATYLYNDANVGTGKTISASGLILQGAQAVNYVLPGNGKATLTTAGEITKASLASLISEDKLSYKCGEAKTCTVIGTATYSTNNLSNPNAWAQSPIAKANSGEDVEVKIGDRAVSGTWKLCSGTQGESAVCTTDKVGSSTLYPKTGIYAWFDASGNNIDDDLIVPLNLTLNPREVTITPNLDSVSNGQKVYDGTAKLTGEITPSSSTPAGVIDGNFLANVVLDTAYFASKAAGSQALTVKWDWGTNATQELKDKYSLQPTTLSGYINKRPLVLTVTPAPTITKEYNGTTALPDGITFNTNTITPVSGLVDGDNLVYSGLSLSNVTFSSSDVNYSLADGGKAVPIPLTVSNFGTLGGTDAGNYTVSWQLEGIITQATIATDGVNASVLGALKQEGSYGQLLGDILIKQAQYPSAANYEFPSILKGHNDVNVRGSWAWAKPDSVLDAGKTTLPNGDCQYTNEQKAIFTVSGNYNYKETEAAVNLCIKPKTLIVAAGSVPSGLGTKVYDGTTEVDISGATAPSLASGTVITQDAGKVAIKIDTAYYNEAFAGTGKTITVEYAIDCEQANETTCANYLPPANYALGSATIQTRPVYITGLVASDKYYNNTEVAEVNTTNMTFAAPTVATGIVADDDVSINSANLEFKFISASAADNVPINISNLNLIGDDASNYSLSYPELSANIYKASLANHLCPQITGKTITECDALTKAQKDAAYAADTALGATSKVTAYLMGNTPITATYGYSYSNYADSLGRLIKAPASLFGIDRGAGSWAWESSSADQATAVGTQLAYARLVEADVNFEQPTNIPIIVNVGKALLEFNANPIARQYKPGDYNVDLTFSLLNVDTSKVKLTIIGKGIITGTSTMTANNNVGMGSANDPTTYGKQISISDLKVEGSDSTNFTLPTDLATGLKNAPIFATITKADVDPATIPNPSPSPYEFVYDTTEYRTLSSITLWQAATGYSKWQWVTGSQTPANPNATSAPSVEGRYKARFIPEDSLNYNIVERDVSLIIKRRSDNNKLAKDGAVAASGVCGENITGLTVKTEDTTSQILYGGVIQGAGNATFKVPLPNYRNNVIPFEVDAQSYEIGPKDYSHTVYRFVPFSKVAKWMRDDGGDYKRNLTVAIDSTDVMLNGIEFDFAKTEWYLDNELVYTGRTYSIDREGRDYSLILTPKNSTKKEDKFVSCKETGVLPGEVPQAVPIAPESNIKLIAHSFKTKMVAGGTSLLVNTPVGSKISIYTANGKLVSTMQAVNNNTVVKVPSTKGMYIIKLEIK